MSQIRLRRLRASSALRELLRETRLSIEDFVLPLFIKAGKDIKQPILSMPGHYQWSIDRLKEEITVIQALGIKAVIIFGIPAYKDLQGSEALKPDSLIAIAIQTIKSLAPELLVITDLCFCEYMEHGHCGVVIPKDHGQYEIDNDQTLALLLQQALIHAQAGADVIAPSGMMDGTIRTLRSGLNQAGYPNIPLLSYAVKYASSFYGPFREAAEGAPQFGDRKTYQLDPANGNLSLREAELDVQEAADMLMVKPANLYLDIIYRVKQQFPHLPLGAYQVSGEFAMIKAAAQQKYLDETGAMLESLIAIKRAGADFIISYFTKAVAQLWQK